jgi:hypothetical protein
VRGCVSKKQPVPRDDAADGGERDIHPPFPEDHGDFLSIHSRVFLAQLRNGGDDVGGHEGAAHALGTPGGIFQTAFVTGTKTSKPSHVRGPRDAEVPAGEAGISAVVAREGKPVQALHGILAQMQFIRMGEKPMDALPVARGKRHEYFVF